MQCRGICSYKYLYSTPGEKSSFQEKKLLLITFGGISWGIPPFQILLNSAKKFCLAVDRLELKFKL